MGLIRKAAGAVGKRLLDFAYNVDRAGASLVGADPQATISSELGLHESNPLDRIGAAALDKIQKSHVEKALSHAEELEQADSGFEG